MFFARRASPAKRLQNFHGGANGTIPALFQPDRMLFELVAFSLARIYISVHSTRRIRLESSRHAASVSNAKARFNGPNTLIAAGGNESNGRENEKVNGRCELR